MHNLIYTNVTKDRSRREKFHIFVNPKERAYFTASWW